MWNEKAEELFIELMYKMSIAQNYNFDKVTIKRSSYSPIAHGNREEEEEAIRKGMVNLLTGKSSLPVVIKDFTPPETNSEDTKK